MQTHGAYDELRAVFGEDGARTRLLSFRKELNAYLAWTGKGSPDQAALRDMAHRIAGHAGFLGFPVLADASARLDEATSLNQGVAEALDHWTEQARRVAEAQPEEVDAAPSDTNETPPNL